MALLLPALLGACLDAPREQTDPGAVEVSGLALLDKATAHAHSWAADAKLQGIFDASTLRPFVPENPSHPLLGYWNATNPLRDSNFSDGKAPSWSYWFGAASREQAMWVVLDATGTVRGTGSQPRLVFETFFGPAPLPSLGIDSDGAMEILRRNLPLWDACMERPEVFRVDMVAFAESSSQARWRFDMFHTDAFKTIGSWTIDALNGTFLGGSKNWSCFAPPREGELFQQAILDPAESTKTYSFKIMAANHTHLYVYLEMNIGPLRREVSLSFVGPLDQSWTFKDSCNANDACTVRNSYRVPFSGDWELNIELLEGIVVDYRLGWCAFGDLEAPRRADEACVLTGVLDP